MNIKENDLRSRPSKDGTYLDPRGVWRLQSNGHRCYRENNHAFGSILFDLEYNPPRPVKDIGKEQAEAEFIKARQKYFEDINNGKDVRETTFMYNSYNWHTNDEVVGVRYKDFKTCRLYIVVKYGGFWWYMDVATKKLVRLSDAYTLTKRHYEELKFYRDHFGEAKYDDEMMKKYDIKTSYEYKDFLDCNIDRNLQNYCLPEDQEKLKASFVYNRNMETNSKGLTWGDWS